MMRSATDTFMLILYFSNTFEMAAFLFQFVRVIIFLSIKTSFSMATAIFVKNIFVFVLGKVNFQYPPTTLFICDDHLATVPLL